MLRWPQNASWSMHSCWELGIYSYKRLKNLKLAQLLAPHLASFSLIYCPLRKLCTYEVRNWSGAERHPPRPAPVALAGARWRRRHLAMGREVISLQAALFY